MIFDRLNRRFLVVWIQQDGTWGQWVNTNGTLFGEGFFIPPIDGAM